MIVQAEEQHGLSGFVVDFAADPPALFLFGLHEMAGQTAHLLL